MDIITIDPAKFSKAQWSYKQWNVLDGLKVDGAGSGYFEYTVSLSENLSLEQMESVALVFEASAKRLLGKDVQGANEHADGDYMRGKGLSDPSKNKNAYPMTGQQTFPSYVKITVNGVVCDNVWLPDDPADHRGALSWFSQPHNKLLNEAGSYGYLVKTLVPVAALTRGQAIRIRLEVPEGVNGGLAIYGKAFGRYPLDPTLVFVGK
jgi:hypothetical protein